MEVRRNIREFRTPLVASKKHTACSLLATTSPASKTSRRRDGRHRRRRRQQGSRRVGQPPQQDSPQERAPVPVHSGIHRVPSRARLPAGAPPRHRLPPHGCHGGVAGRGAAVRAPARDAGRQERHRGRRVHRVLAARHRPRAPRRWQGRGHRRHPRALRPDRIAGDREGRRRAQDRLPRRARAAGAGSDGRRGGEQGRVRLRVRGRGQGELSQLPRAAAAACPGRGPHRLRQHAVGRLGGRNPRRAARRRHQGVQRGHRRRSPRPRLPARHRGRAHAVPPRRLITSARCPPRDEELCLSICDDTSLYWKMAVVWNNELISSVKINRADALLPCAMFNLFVENLLFSQLALARDGRPATMPAAASSWRRRGDLWALAHGRHVVKMATATKYPCTRGY